MTKDYKTVIPSFMVWFFLVISTISFASTPPPTVKQNIGIADTTFENLTKLNCAYCHAPEKLTQQQREEMGWTFDIPELKPGILADRHHAKLIDGLIMSEHTQAPFGTAGEVYTCFSCHKIEWNELSLRYELSDNFKDCHNCHKEQNGATVHHLTPQAQALNCKHCHGDRIDNPNSGHYIPYDKTPTNFTPRTSRGKGPNGEGACTFCHKAGVDSASGIVVNSNAINHHSTGVGQGGVSKLHCTLCHDSSAGTDWAIRRCQNCHSVNSLHSIQADSNGDGIIKIGEELPYFGHVGNEKADCKGCHTGYFELEDALDMLTKASISPEISNLSTFKIVLGVDTTLNVSGVALTDVLSNKRTKSVVTMANKDGKEIELIPDFVSETSLTITVPNSLSLGNYYLRVKKGLKNSNPINVVVIPSVIIDKVDTSNELLIVKGQGFGKYMDGLGSKTKISLGESICSVDSWSDDKIIAQCALECGELVVDSIFGKSNYMLDCIDSNNNYQEGYDASYKLAFTQGNSDKCEGRTWSIDANLKYDTRFNQGYADGYVYAYDEGWESSCGEFDDGDFEVGYEAAQDAGFTQGSYDKCSGKTWNIEVLLRYDTKYEQGYSEGYIEAYDDGWESCN